MQSVRKLVLTAAVFLVPLGAGADQSRQITFDLHLFGLRSGIVAINLAQNETSYAAVGRMESRGIIGAISPMRYDVRSRGRVVNGALVPERYEDEVTEGGGTIASVMEYRNGVPQERRYTPPREPEENDLDPASQRGTVDVMTALVLALRDVPRDEACQIDLDIFDGLARTRVIINNPVADGELLRCQGEFQRVAGFTAEQLADRRKYDFQVTFAPNTSGDMQVQEIRTESKLGRARLTRR